MINYMALLETSYGLPLGRFDTLLSLQAVRSFNTVGSIALTVPDIYPPELWQRDMRIKLYRSTYGGPRHLVGNTIWFLRKFTWQYSQKQWLLEGKDALSILERPIVAYTSDTLYADKTIDNGNDDTADNLIKAYLRENIGSLVTDTTRDLSAYITIEPDRSYASSTEKQASGRDLFTVINELCNDAAAQGIALYFDLVPNEAGTFTFKVFQNYMGTDRTVSPNITFSPNYRNLTDVNLVWDYSNEITVARMGGEGQDADRLIETVQDDTRIAASPFGRIEKFVDDKDVDSTTVLQADGRSYLNKYTPRLTLDGKIIDTPTMLFGRDFFYGDLVNASVENLNFTCVFDQMNLSYSKGQETLDLRLKGNVAL